jgi:hypothetical protein
VCLDDGGNLLVGICHRSLQVTLVRFGNSTRVGVADLAEPLAVSDGEWIEPLVELI